MHQQPRYITPYQQLVLDAVLDLREKGHRFVTPTDIAHSMGRKATGSLRRALSCFEEQAVIALYRFYTERGGLALGVDLDPDSNDLPEAPAW